MSWRRRATGTDVASTTIADFGEQWTRYPDNSGYYGSLALFRDIVGPLVHLDAIRGATVADVGSGTGRIARMLVAAAAGHVFAIEPSRAVETLRDNVRDLHGRVTVIHGGGDAIPTGLGLDMVFAIGVLHHIPDPVPTVAAMLAALRPGGTAVVWVYGLEGNEAYLSMVRPLRWLTTRAPHVVVGGLSHVLSAVLDAYILLARIMRVPLAGYVRHTLSKLSRDKRRLVIYDQLHPRYAKYYTRADLCRLLETAGFTGVAVYHRHGYSWTAVGRKPSRTDGGEGS